LKRNWLQTFSRFASSTDRHVVNARVSCAKGLEFQSWTVLIWHSVANGACNLEG